MTDLTESGLPRAVAIAWGLLAEPTRGPNRALSHERIIDAGIDIADAEGIAAVTMARVAATLGFSTMALYRYVSNKDELLLLMVDAAVRLPEDRLPRHSQGTDWREALTAWVDALRQVYRARPWTLEVTRGPVSVLMPSSVMVADSGLGALSELRLTDQERIAVILSLSSYVTAFVELERDLADQDVLEFGEEAMNELASVITPERWPHLAPLMLSGEYVGGAARNEMPSPGGAVPDSNDVEFEFQWGVDRLLDGIELLHTTRGERWVG